MNTGTVVGASQPWLVQPATFWDTGFFTSPPPKTRQRKPSRSHRGSEPCRPLRIVCGRSAIPEHGHRSPVEERFGSRTAAPSLPSVCALVFVYYFPQFVILRYFSTFLVFEDFCIFFRFTGGLLCCLTQTQDSGKIMISNPFCSLTSRRNRWS